MSTICFIVVLLMESNGIESNRMGCNAMELVVSLLIPLSDSQIYYSISYSHYAFLLASNIASACLSLFRAQK